MFVCQVLNKEEQELAARNEYNFDHPDAFDFELLVNVLRKLKKGKSVKVPVYDFTSHCRRKEWVRSQPGGLPQTPGGALLMSFSVRTGPLINVGRSLVLNTCLQDKILRQKPVVQLGFPALMGEVEPVTRLGFIDPPGMDSSTDLC